MPTPTPMSLEKIEAALDARCIEVLCFDGKWRTIRRNGATQRWKRDPTRFRIPVKLGFNAYSAITNADLGKCHHRIVHDARADFKLEYL